MKVGQCGTGNGYNNGTLIISVFPNRISCQNHLQDVENGGIRGQDRRGGTGFSSGQGWVCDLGSVAKLCVHSLLTPTHKGMVFCVEERCSGLGASLVSAKTGPRLASKQVVGQAQ